MALLQFLVKKWDENANIQTYIESKQLMKLTALSVGIEEIEMPAIRKLQTLISVLHFSMLLL